MKWLALPVFAGTLLFVAPPGFAQKTLGILAAQNASGFRQEVGRRLTFVCPASDGSNVRIYGTDTYTDDSSICGAAIHAGALKPGTPGVVSIVMGSGAPGFPGSERNGVASKTYGAWPHSFTVATDGGPATIAWTTVWNQMPADFTAPLVVTCPAGGKIDALIWGTDVYITDSSICVAAVHSGVITAEKGGSVTVTRARTLGEYPGTERHGVVSRRWGAWNDAFSVTVAASPAPALVAGTTTVTLEAGTSRTSLAALTPSTGTTAAPAPRTIALTGFTAAGLSPAVPARTIALAGFSAAGASPAVPGRTIALGGFTAAGTSPAVPARSIALAGFTATSTSPTVPARTIALAGFAAMGSSPAVPPRTIALSGFRATGP